MKVSIITVAYNSESTIEETIQSVLSQDYFAIEYIVIDGGSNDGTLDLIKKYQAKIDYFISEPDQGIYDAMNKGVRASSGELIGILNSDDVYNNKTIISELVDKVKDYDAVYGDLVYVKPNNLNKIKRVWKSGNYKSSSFIRGWMPPHPHFL
jgi:glycosyltransferase involved in cell wall biosynthesis